LEDLHVCNQLRAADSHPHSVSGMRCGAYHAGLRPAERERVLGDWTGGRLPAVAATVAFGMGIDRGGVALVAHYNLPKTLEGFYQVGSSRQSPRAQHGCILPSTFAGGIPLPSPGSTWQKP
jgi:ATP-dependent helicase YprA (DUF1998 family)